MKEKNNRLAIAIPTYNRTSILRENIYLMIDEIKKYSIPIYISDDSDNDNTERFVKEIADEYDLIFYFRNIPSLGHDKNCIKTLSLPSEDYVWYLGDSIIISPGYIGMIIDTVKYEQIDFISVNASGRINIPSKIYTNGNELLTELGWHLTLTGSTIYSKEALKILSTIDLNKCRNFPQISIIFNKFSMGNQRLYWLNHNIIYANSRKRSYWASNVFSVFLYDWNYFIMNLPDYYNEQNKRFAIRLHTEKTGIFKLSCFLTYRSAGFFNLKVLKEFKLLILDNCNLNYFTLLIIAVFPKKIILLLKKLIKGSYGFITF